MACRATILAKVDTTEWGVIDYQRGWYSVTSGDIDTMASDGSALIKVVCIEDEREMIDLVELILNKQGIKVFGAEGGHAGLDMVRQLKPDLVLLDLMMPDMDGWEVYQQMKTDPATANIPVIIVTAKAQSIDKVLGLHIAKVDDYITKPFGPYELSNSVDRVLHRRQAAGDQGR